MPRIWSLILMSTVFVLGLQPRVLATDKAKISLDEFFNSVDYDAVELSPDGNAIIIGTARADWERNIFRHELWLYRSVSSGQNSLVQLTQSGYDSAPQWSPDGKWIAFLSGRESGTSKNAHSDESNNNENTSQVYLIAADGGEAFPVTEGNEEVHAFSWGSDSNTLYFATRTPWSEGEKDDYRQQWKDTIQYRGAERGDVIFAITVSSALSRHRELPKKPPSEKGEDKDRSDRTEGSRSIAKTPWRVSEIVVSPDGAKLAFQTTAISERQEKVEEFEIYVVDLAQSSLEHDPVQVTHNHAVEQHVRWAPDNRHISFTVEVGDVEDHYRDLQPHLYWVDTDNKKVQQWNQEFAGSVSGYEWSNSGALIEARTGTEVPVYLASSPETSLLKLDCRPGTYSHISTAKRSKSVAFVYSSLETPTEVYLSDTSSPRRARPITTFNKLFTERELPQGEPYRWTADDGTKIEGMLIYPPGKFREKHLPVCTFIHGGPADADGNHFEADWYQWDRLAATQGWLVF